jgi:hypothetical protein
VIGGDVCVGCAREPVPLSSPTEGLVAGVVAGAVAAGVFTDGVVLELLELASTANQPEKAATSATPTPASHRVVDEMRRMPLSRSVGRCGATHASRIGLLVGLLIGTGGPSVGAAG